MRPGGRLSCHSSALRAPKQRPKMSAGGARDTFVHDLDRRSGKSRQNAKKGMIKDCRWTASSDIKFQQPLQPRRLVPSPVHDTSERKSQLSRSFSSSSIHTSNTFLQSQDSRRSGQLGLQSTDRLSYPDLSFSTFAPARELSSPIVIPSLPSEPTIVEQPTSSSINDPTDTLIPVPDEPFRSPRGFYIPKIKLENALQSLPGSATSFWHYTLYEGPGYEREGVKLHYCKTQESTETVARTFLNEDVIGFDIEWVAQAKSTDSIKQNVALIQFASEERIALFHIAQYPGPENIENLVAPTLKQIMESPKISKVGVAIKGDCTRLKKFLHIHCRGLFELSYLHKLVQYRSGQIDKVDRKLVRLAEQVHEHLRLPLHKGDVQTSNWRLELDHQQAQYAASDAYAALQVYHTLEAKRKAFDPMPPRPAHAELNIAISLGDVVPKSHLMEHEDDENLNDESSVSSSDVSIEELAREYFHISLNDEAPITSENLSKSLLSSGGVQNSQSASASTASKLSTKSRFDVAPTEGIDSPEMDIANQFVAAFKPPAKRRMAPQTLRAYSLWHKQRLSISETAAILRRPPLKQNTVISYLCDAINLGNLHYEPERVVEFSSKYAWRPYFKAHGDLLDRAKKKGQRSQKTNDGENEVQTSQEILSGTENKDQSTQYQ